MGLFNALNLTGHNIQGFIPGDTHPFILTAEFFSAAAGLPIFPFHRIFQPIGPQNLLTLRPPAQAASLLREIRAVRMCIIGLLS
jgi:hypothetical protein